MTTATDIIATAEPSTTPHRGDEWGFGYWYEKSKGWVIQTCYSEEYAREQANERPHGFVFCIPGTGPSLLDAERARAVAAKAREDAEASGYQGGGK